MEGWGCSSKFIPFEEFIHTGLDKSTHPTILRSVEFTGGKNEDVDCLNLLRG